MIEVLARSRKEQSGERDLARMSKIRTASDEDDCILPRVTSAPAGCILLRRLRNSIRQLRIPKRWTTLATQDGDERYDAKSVRNGCN
jgi:hypothetical protein